MGIFQQAVANIAYLRAQAGGGMTRLNFSADALSSMETNMRAAIGRIEDVDIAAESANLAKIQHLNPSLGRHGRTGKLYERRSANAPEITLNEHRHPSF